ncbi:hypothetical protein [Pseudodesulfovibrio cashew]|nr:hypothetical protein [Pseudodesulfovibrio cashew]
MERIEIRTHAREEMVGRTPLRQRERLVLRCAPALLPAHHRAVMV